MEPSQFDEFTKSLATPTSRRQALKRLAAGTFGSILALSGLGTAFAKTKCPPGLTDCGGKCVDTKKDPNNCGVCGTKCKSGLCVNGLCCPPGANQCGNSCCSFTCCPGNVCTDTQNDKKNCGSCGNVCPSGDICKNGQCVKPTCSPVTCAPPSGCNNNPNCSCFHTAEGGVACTQEGFCNGCTSSSSCPPGQVCVVNTCCGSACLALCP